MADGLSPVRKGDNNKPLSGAPKKLTIVAAYFLTIIFYKQEGRYLSPDCLKISAPGNISHSQRLHLVGHHYDLLWY